MNALTEENNALRTEVDRLTDLCNKFSAENAAFLVSRSKYFALAFVAQNICSGGFVLVWDYFPLKQCWFLFNHFVLYCRSDWGNET